MCLYIELHSYFKNILHHLFLDKNLRNRQLKKKLEEVVFKFPDTLQPLLHNSVSYIISCLAFSHTCLNKKAQQKISYGDWGSDDGSLRNSVYCNNDIVLLSCVCEFLQAWFMEENDEDQRLPHHRNPKEFVSPDHLAGFIW